MKEIFDQLMPMLSIVGRSVAVYTFLLIAFRVLGRKELSQLAIGDIVLLLLISNSVQNAMVGANTSLLGGLCAAAVLLLFNKLIKRINYTNRFYQKIMDQHPEVLIHNGILDFKKLSRWEVTHDELMEALREHGIDNVSEVKWAMLEMDGTISIISKKEGGLHQSEYKRKKMKNAMILRH